MSTLDQSVFASRRAKLAKAMGAYAIAIIGTRDEMYRNRDVDYKYRPDSFISGNAAERSACERVRLTIMSRPLRFNSQRLYVAPTTFN